MIDRPRSAVRAAVAGVTLAALAGRAAAHGGETTGPHDAPLAVAVGIAGIGLVAVSVYVDARREVARRYVDGGVFLGVAAALAGIALYWL